MKLNDAISHYRSAAELARALKVTPQAVSNWKTRHDGKVPKPYALELHYLTRGRLKFDPKAYEQS